MGSKFVKELKPYLAVIFVQFASAGSAIIAKAALNHGMSHYAFSVYRNIIATVIVSPAAFVLERKIRPRMTFSIMNKIMLLALLEPVIDQNMYYAGMKYTTPTVTMAMCNVIPSITFLLAWALKLERVNVKRLASQAKIVGTLTTFGGAMIMTLVRGTVIGLPWTKLIEPKSQVHGDDGRAHQDAVKGALMVTAGCFCASTFYILQAITLKSYPAALSLTGLICVAGSLQGAVLTLVAERGHPSVWSIGWDYKLLAYAYSGLIGSGVNYYVVGLVNKGKGPVFVTSFSPLSMVAAAVMSSFIFAEQLDVGKVTGAVVIVIGLYLVVWGKNKDRTKPFGSLPESMIDQEAASATNTCTNATEYDSADVESATNTCTNSTKDDDPGVSKAISEDNAV